MSNAVDREGTFRGLMMAVGLVKGKSPSRSVGVTFTARLDEYWYPEANDGAGGWYPWEDRNQEADGAVWIVGKDGQVSKQHAEALMACTGWNGDVTEITSGNFQPQPCQFIIKEDTYNNQTRLKVAFLNSFDAVPGAGNVSPDEAKQLQDQLGSQFRAIASTIKRNTAPPANGKPSSPPKREPATVQQGDGSDTTEKIPF